MGGVQWLPTADAVIHSQRMTVTDQFALTFSPHPYNPDAVVVAILFQLPAGAYSDASTRCCSWEFGLYSGAIPSARTGLGMDSLPGIARSAPGWS